MPGLFQLCKGSWESFSLTFQKCNLPRAGGHQRLSEDSQTPLNPNLGSLPSTKNEKKPQQKQTNKWKRTMLDLWINILNVCVERITAPNNHFLQFLIPTEEIFIGPNTGCLIKTKCLCPTPWRTGGCDQNHQFRTRWQVCISIYLCSSTQLNIFSNC